MKKALLILTLLCSSIGMYAQWMQTTNTKSKTLVYNNSRLIGGGGGAGGILISDDEGTTWTASNTGVPAWMINDIDPKLAIGNTIYAVAINKLLISTDNGNNWAEGTSTLPATSTISVIYYDGTTIFVTYQDGKVYTSTDAGANFSLKGNVGIYPVCLTTYNGVLYAGTNGGAGVYKSTDGGATWAAENTGIGSTDKQVYAMNIFSGNLYMGTYSGKVYKLDAGTATWNSIYTGSPMRDLCSVSNAIMAATDNGYAASLDNGATWTASNTGLTGLDLYFLHIYATASNVLVTKFYGGVLKRSFSELGIGSATGIATTASNKGISLYPNPANNTVYVNGIASVAFTYIITDVTGRTISTATATGNSIPVNNLQPGTYQLQITTATGNYNSRFIKQ